MRVHESMAGEIREATFHEAIVAMGHPEHVSVPARTSVFGTFHRAVPQGDVGTELNQDSV